jgi:hypothetical protein
MKPSPLEKVSPVLDLESIDLEIPKLANAQEPIQKEKESLKVLYDGVLLDLNVNYFSSFEDDSGLSFWIWLAVSTEKPKDLAHMIVEVKRKKYGGYVATSSVENFIRERKGLGRTLWEISLKLIQKLVDESGIHITHEVYKEPSHDLSVSKWDELFLPLLEKHGYKKVKTNAWELTYLPHKK